MLLLPGKSALFLFGQPQKFQINGAVSCWFVSVFLFQGGCVLMYLCLGDIIRKGGCFQSATRDSFLQLPTSLCDTNFGACFCRAFHRHVYLKAFCAGWETAVGTGWSAAGDSRSATTYRACEGRPQRRCVGGWREEEGRGNRDRRRAAAFIPWKLIPPFVHLSPLDKMGWL